MSDDIHAALMTALNIGEHPKSIAARFNISRFTILRLASRIVRVGKQSPLVEHDGDILTADESGRPERHADRPSHRHRAQRRAELKAANETLLRSYGLEPRRETIVIIPTDRRSTSWSISKRKRQPRKRCLRNTDFRLPSEGARSWRE